MDQIMAFLSLHNFDFKPYPKGFGLVQIDLDLQKGQALTPG